MTKQEVEGKKKRGGGGEQESQVVFRPQWGAQTYCLIDFPSLFKPYLETPLLFLDCLLLLFFFPPAFSEKRKIQ